MTKKDELFGWLNDWANFYNHNESTQGDYITAFGRGYKQAVLDITSKLKKDKFLKFKQTYKIHRR